MLHKRLIINGEEFPLASAQSGPGAPCDTTPGCVGVTYMDEETGEMYKCIRCADGCTEWEPIGSAAELEKKVNDLEKRLEEHINPYVNIAISNQTHGIATQEKGTVINSVTISWNFNRTPQSLTIRGPGIDGTMALDVTTKRYAIPDQNLGITFENTNSFKWTIKAVGERGEANGDVSTKTTAAIVFQNRIYYGTAPDPRNSGGEITSDFVKSLQYKPLSAGKYTPINVNAADGEYIWYCLPQWMELTFGECIFMSGANQLIWDKVPLKVKITETYSEDYYVYRSGNEGLGSQKLGVE